MDDSKRLEKVLKGIIKLGISQTKAIMHITAALDSSPAASPELRGEVKLAREQIDNMIEAIDHLATLYSADGDSNE
ncbi:MAG: hypothetical protein K2Y24_07510 [Pseudomonadaceae bacterium]|nr:hypothetical protein [Pseudomonadaceae bacterium]